MLPVTFTVPARFKIPPLTISWPAPVMEELLVEVNVPPKLTAVPAGTFMVPLCDPPPVKASVPPWMSTRLKLFTCAPPILVVPLPVMRNVPALSNREAPPPKLTDCGPWIWNKAPGVLVMTAVFMVKMPVPFQTAVPAL